MKQDTRVTQVGKALRYLNDGLPQAPGLNARNIAAYAVVLHGIPVEVIRQAAFHILSTWDKATILPTPSVVRTAALEVLARAAGIPTAAAGWAEVQQSIQAFGVRGQPLTEGGYSGIEWSHQVIGTAVETIGGVSYLSRNENMSADRAHWFRYVYPAALSAWYGETHERLKIAAGTGPGLLERGRDQGNG